MVTEIIIGVLLLILILGNFFRDKVRKLLDGKPISSQEQQADEEKEKVINGTSTKDKRSKADKWKKRYHSGGILEYRPIPYEPKPDTKPVPTRRRREEE